MPVQEFIRKLAKLICPVILAMAMLCGLLLIYGRSSPVVSAAPLNTPVSGDITTNTTWPVISSPFTVTGIVRVMNGARLTIEPGVQVRFLPGAQLRILDSGQLMAVGTSAQTITFTSDSPTPAPGDWNGILFESDALTGTIQHAIIEYAKFGVEIDRSFSFQLYNVSSNTFRYIGGTPGVAILGTPDFAELSHNAIYSAVIGLQLDEVADNLIQDNQIYNIQNDCITFRAVGVPSLDNQLIGNQIHDCGARGISLDSGGTTGGSANAVINNQIWNIGNEALYADNQNNFDFQANIVYSAALTGSTLGAVVLERLDGASIEDNYLYGNGAAGSYEGALHILTFGPSFTTPINITDNRLRDSHGSGLVFRGLNSFSTQTIHSNALCVDDRYEIENRSTNSFTLEAGGNWLGTNFPVAGTEITGTVNISPHIRLSANAAPSPVPADGLTPALVTVTMNDGAGHTVPLDARQINLTTTLGTLASISLTLNSSGIATTTLTSAIPGTATITVAEWCDYVITTTVQFVATDLTIQKSSAITQVTPGQTVTYTIAYSNSSSVTATNVVITDTLPAGMVWVTDTAQSQGFTRVQTSPQVVWTTPSLNPGANGTFTLVAQLQSCAQTITNTITIASATADSNPTNNTALHGNTGVICPVILNVHKDDGVICVAPGQTISYTITYSNTGSVPANNVFLIDDKPDFTNFLPGGVNNGWVDTGGGVFTRSVGTVATGTLYGPLYFQVQVAATLPPTLTAITNVIQISGGGSHTEVTSAPLVPDLAVAKNDNIGPTGVSAEFAALYERVTGTPPAPITAQADEVDPGGIIEYTIVYVNNGRASATGVVLTDTLPLYTQYAGGPEWTPASGQIFTHNVGTLNPGQGGLISFRVQLTNTIPLTHEQIINQVQIGGNENALECNLSNSVSFEQTPINLSSGSLYLPIILKF